MTIEDMDKAVKLALELSALGVTVTLQKDQWAALLRAAEIGLQIARGHCDVNDVARYITEGK